MAGALTIPLLRKRLREEWPDRSEAAQGYFTQGRTLLEHMAKNLDQAP